MAKEKIKINNVFSSWKDLIFGVPQRSVLGPLLNLYLNDLFFFLKDVSICNFAECTIVNIFFMKCSMKCSMLANVGLKIIIWNWTHKCHLIASGYKHEQVGEYTETMNLGK